jgi:hypothetical protein
MNRFLLYIRNNIRRILTISAFVVTSVVIVYFLPREGKFMFEYQKGGFWKHEDLTAPFSFPISKSGQEIVKERDSVLSEFRPIFNYDQQIADARIQEIGEDFSNAWINYSISKLKIPSRDIYRRDIKYTTNRQLENQYRNYLKSLVRDIYRKGIIDLASLEETGQN